ncbi:MAG TPA: hypothetical protein VJ161_11770, partial [Geobacteraceae bacterium]|nr:hypothetical protein [Geobacteraceae bacterium]
QGLPDDFCSRVPEIAAGNCPESEDYGENRFLAATISCRGEHKGYLVAGNSGNENEGSPPALRRAVFLLTVSQL